MKQLSMFDTEETEVRLNYLYLLDGEFLRCTKLRESGINTFELCDEKGVTKPFKRNDKGHITDYGTRLIKRRTSELKTVLNCL